MGKENLLSSAGIRGGRQRLQEAKLPWKQEHRGPGINRAQPLDIHPSAMLRASSQHCTAPTSLEHAGGTGTNHTALVGAGSWSWNLPGAFPFVGKRSVVLRLGTAMQGRERLSEIVTNQPLTHHGQPDTWHYHPQGQKRQQSRKCGQYPNNDPQPRP